MRISDPIAQCMPSTRAAPVAVVAEVRRNDEVHVGERDVVDSIACAAARAHPFTRALRRAQSAKVEAGDAPDTVTLFPRCASTVIVRHSPLPHQAQRTWAAERHGRR